MKHGANRLHNTSHTSITCFNDSSSVGSSNTHFSFESTSWPGAASFHYKVQCTCMVSYYLGIYHSAYIWLAFYKGSQFYLPPNMPLFPSSTASQPIGHANSCRDCQAELTWVARQTKITFQQQSNRTQSPIPILTGSSVEQHRWFDQYYCQLHRTTTWQYKNSSWTGRPCVSRSRYLSAEIQRLHEGNSENVKWLRWHNGEIWCSTWMVGV